MQIEKQVANFFSIIRKCRLEEIDLPLESGTLDLPQDTSAQQEATIKVLKKGKRSKGDMEKDGENERKSKKKVEKYEPFPIRPNYSKLPADAKSIKNLMEYERICEEKMEAILMQIEKLSPNLRALEK